MRADSSVGTIYLLHFTKPVGRGHRHYLGWSADPLRRLKRHQAGFGAQETKRALAEGARLIMVQTWPGTPRLEAQIKNWCRRHRVGFAGLCPKCAHGRTLPPDLQAALGPGSMRRIYLSGSDQPET
jgi:predicted GIY-YIG superfamily endonuclease